MGDIDNEDDTRALEFFSRIEDAIISSFDEDVNNKSSSTSSNGELDIICARPSLTATVTTELTTANSSISSSGINCNNNQIETEEEDNSLSSSETMIIGKEDSDPNNKSYTVKEEEDGTLGDMDVEVQQLPLPAAATRISTRISTRSRASKNSNNDSNNTTDQSIETVTVVTNDTAVTSTTAATTGNTNEQSINKEDDDGDCDGDDVNNSDDDDDGASSTSSRISEPSTSSAMKFQPLQPLPGKSLDGSGDSSSCSSSNKTSSSTSAIPPINSNYSSSSAAAGTKQEGGGGGLKFMNNIQDPVAASKGIRTKKISSVNGEATVEDGENSTSATGTASIQQQQQQISHTPPNNLSTSYESKHFGKRPRTGSLSERLLVSAELEAKGVITRDQKGILKDLIISGQDNEIQDALDRYEQGDATMLEGMLTSGTLSGKATEEIDLLGQLDFDFLNVKEQEKKQNNGDPNNSNNTNNSTNGKTSGSVASDGIGDLEFDGGIGNWEQGENNSDSDNSTPNTRSRSNSTWSTIENRTRANSTWTALESALQQQQQRSRANSAMSIDLDQFRSRSNSLFSPLIGNEAPEATTTQATNFGRWMETSGSSSSGAAASGTAGQGQSEGLQKPTEQQQKLLQQQQHHEHHFQQLLSQQKEKKDQQNQKKKNQKKQKPKPKSKTKVTKPIYRRKSAPGEVVTRGSKPPSAAAIAKEHQKEQKRKERTLKKEQKEKEKYEKKELKERAKQEKQKKKEVMDKQEKEKEKEMHIPGSGRPRSMSDPNLNSKVGEDGLLEVERPDGWIGAYSPESRLVRIGRFMEKRNHRVWTKTVKYDVRKNFADSRLRVKGRFVKKDDELLMRELMSLT